MPGTFEPLPGGGAAVALDDVEISIIRSLAVQLMELIGPGPAEESGDPLADLFARVARGELRPRLGGVYPLADAARAHEDLEARRTTGKLTLDPTA